MTNVPRSAGSGAHIFGAGVLSDAGPWGKTEKDYSL